MGKEGSASWPAMSLKEERQTLCGAGAVFEMEDVEVGGVHLRSWKNGPRVLPDLVRSRAPHDGQSLTWISRWHQACV